MEIHRYHLLKMAVLILLSVVTLESVAQNYKSIKYPYVGKQSHPYIIITEIERRVDCTKIYFYYRSPYQSGGWMNFNKNTYLQTLDGKKYNVISSEGIPLSPNRHYFNNRGESVSFCLVFPKLPDNIKYFVAIGEPVSDGFAFYSVKLEEDFQGYLRRCNEIESLSKDKVDRKSPSVNNRTTKRKLKKDPNFKIE